MILRTDLRRRLDQHLGWILRIGETLVPALAQRQFYFVAAFFVGMVGGAIIAYVVGYNDIVLAILKWVVSGAGLALIFSALNLGKIYSFKCPRCDQIYFRGAPGGVFSKQCGTCGLPLNLPNVDLTP